MQQVEQQHVHLPIPHRIDQNNPFGMMGCEVQAVITTEKNMAFMINPHRREAFFTDMNFDGKGSNATWDGAGLVLSYKDGTKKEYPNMQAFKVDEYITTYMEYLATKMGY